MGLTRQDVEEELNKIGVITHQDSLTALMIRVMAASLPEKQAQGDKKDVVFKEKNDSGKNRRT